MLLSNSIPKKTSTLNVLSSITHSINNCNFSTNQQNHLLLKNKISTQNLQYFKQKKQISNLNSKIGETRRFLSTKNVGLV